jgi:UDP-glucose 4-epimerase
MRVLVTGAFGYVGRALTYRLVESGHEVVALTHRPPGAQPTDASAVQVAHADLCDVDSLRKAVVGIDAVCHLAALTRVRASFEHPEEYQAVNNGGTVALLGLLAEGRVARFVHASSAAVYGTPVAQPVNEDAVPAPTSPYGESKLAADRAVEAYSLAGRVAAISLRAFNIAGAVAGHGDPDETRIIPKALAVAAGRHPELTVNGDGSAVRDFVHVDDLASAYLLALDACKSGTFRTYNVGATGASVRDIIAVAELVTRCPIPVRHNPPQPEAPVLLADTRRIREELGWAPVRSSLEEIISDSWAALI